MNKALLRQAIIDALDAQLNSAIKAADEARDLATHEQSQPETQYDTVGLEASYLAHGQSQRVLELQETIQLYRKLPFKTFSEDDPIGLTALICVRHENTSDEAYFFIGPQAGGLVCEVEGQSVQIITPDAPVSQQLMGLYDGDELQFSHELTLTEIIQVC